MKEFLNKISLFLNWFFGVPFILVGIIGLSDNFIFGISFLIAGLLLIPPINNFIETRLKISIKAWKKILVVFFILFLGAAFSTNKDAPIVEKKIPQKEITEEIKPETQKKDITPNVVEEQNLQDKNNLTKPSNQLEDAIQKTINIELENELEPNEEDKIQDKEASDFISRNARVSKVIDGDTIDITDENNLTERVRVIGIDTPETKDPRKAVQCFGEEASQKAYETLFNKKVSLLIPKNGERDKYDRLLAYIQIDDEKIDYGGFMISKGYAYHYRTYPHDKSEEYDALEKLARENKLGLWAEDTCNGLPTPIETTVETIKETVENIVVEEKEEQNIVPEPIIIQEQIIDCVCDKNAKNCSDFLSQKKSQAYFECCMNKVGFDIHKLDGDNNGVACESL